MQTTTAQAVIVRARYKIWRDFNTAAIWVGITAFVCIHWRAKEAQSGSTAAD
jgi:hypothetical protein